MKTVQQIALALVLVAVGVLATAAAFADDAKPERKGVVIKIEEKQITLRAKKPGVADVITIVVPIDDKTTVTLDGAESKIADLKLGYQVTATPIDGTATTITATVPKRIRDRQPQP
jgi:hypothetical protein